jgi:hypothetical protein
MRTVIKENFKFCFGDGNVGEEIMVRKESERGKGCTRKRWLIRFILMCLHGCMLKNESDSGVEKKVLVTAKDAEKIKNE